MSAAGASGDPRPVLPRWPLRTAATLAVAGPHAIPVSTAVRAGDDRILLALGGRRETLARLREDPRAALLVLAKGLAFTAHGRATVISEPLEASSGVVAVELRVDRVQDHLADGRTEMLAAARWRWHDERAAAYDRAILAELEALAGTTAGLDTAHMSSDSPIATLEQWEEGGAIWRALHVSDAHAIVELRTCTGEPVERLESGDPELIAYLRKRPAGPPEQMD